MKLLASGPEWTSDRSKNRSFTRAGIDQNNFGPGSPASHLLPADRIDNDLFVVTENTRCYREIL
jgi:hypothetical protein